MTCRRCVRLVSVAVLWLAVLWLAALPSRAHATTWSLSGASPLGRGQVALRLSGGLVAFVPGTVAGLVPLADGFVPFLPEGQIALGIGAGRADVFATFTSVGGLIQHLGAEGRFAFLRLARVAAALTTRLEYQARGVAVDSFAFIGTLRAAPDLRAEVAVGPVAFACRLGVTIELLHSDYIDSHWRHDGKPRLSSYDVAVGLEWAWGSDARFYIMARAEVAADPHVVLDRAWIGLSVGGGFPL